jgi:hypothetical protein
MRKRILIGHAGKKDLTSGWGRGQPDISEGRTYHPVRSLLPYRLTRVARNHRSDPQLGLRRSRKSAALQKVGDRA